MNNEQMKKHCDDAFEVLEVLEDSVQFLCDEKKLSGLKVLSLIHI